MEKQEKNDDVKNHDQEQELNDQNDAQPDNSDSEKGIEELTQEVALLKDKLLRQMAESENIRNRSTKMVNDARDYAISDFAKDLIPVMDNFSRALEHLPPEMTDDMKNIIDGIKMTKNELTSVFKKYSLEAVEPQAGDKFDYNIHHAISEIVTEDHKEGSVVSTMQVGYKLKDRLVRPAAVSVAKTKE